MGGVRQAIDIVSAYGPVCEQEARDREAMLAYLASHPGALTREDRVAHMSASAWVTNARHDRVLMCYHRIYDSWSWLGGHADGESDLQLVAMREACEESGLPGVRAVGESPASIEILTVGGHEKRGRYVPSHLHLNVTYLLEADDEAPLRRKADENAAVAWFAPDAALAASTEPWLVERIYPKLIARL